MVEYFENKTVQNILNLRIKLDISILGIRNGSFLLGKKQKSTIIWLQIFFNQIGEQVTIGNLERKAVTGKL